MECHVLYAAGAYAVGLSGMKPSFRAAAPGVLSGLPGAASSSGMGFSLRSRFVPSIPPAAEPFAAREADAGRTFPVGFSEAFFRAGASAKREAKPPRADAASFLPTHPGADFRKSSHDVTAQYVSDCLWVECVFGTWVDLHMSGCGSQREPLSVSVSGSLTDSGVGAPSWVEQRQAAFERRACEAGGPASDAEPEGEDGAQAGGGQAGRKGETLRRAARPDRAEDHVPVCCRGCGASLSGAAAAGAAVARRLFDLPAPRPLEVVEHRVHGRRCGRCGVVTRVGFPAGVLAAAQ